MIEVDELGSPSLRVVGAGTWRRARREGGARRGHGCCPFVVLLVARCLLLLGSVDGVDVSCAQACCFEIRECLLVSDS